MKLAHSGLPVAGEPAQATITPLRPDAPGTRLPEARKPAFQLMIDFGPAIGVKKSSAQITKNYRLDELIGRQVAAVVNFPPRQIGPIMSEVLTLGFPDEAGEVTLFAPDKKVPNGGRLY